LPGRLSLTNRYCELSGEVRSALSEGRPVVALESTIICHGMPYPQNVDTALAVERCVRENGAVPATVAIINGKLTCGLSEADVERLGKLASKVPKVSRRDIPFVLAQGGDGATTVASTMIAAGMAGIRLFATGGIGGAHRGAQQTFDVSADLQELGRTSVAVVCAGAKSILDLGLTLEYLETQGVPVVGYRTDEFPAFYTSSSGIILEHRQDSALEIARMLKAKWDAGLSGGAVIANPIPKEYSMDPGVMEKAIERALSEAASRGVRGKETTPFLLARVNEITGGESLESNIALVRGNAELAARISVELGRL
jgi:pseudouridine-5'-phosphate glycosidase